MAATTTRRRVLFLLVASIVLAPVHAAWTQQPPTISPRDQIAISVWNAGENEEMYTGKFPVDIDGTFEYPTFGRVKAGGLTTRELEDSLKSMLEKYLVSPQVTIELEMATGKKVVIAGQVRAPAAYQFAGEMTLFEALTRAGSITADASDEAVIHRVVEGPSGELKEETIRVDLHDLLTGESLKANIVLRDGDMIVVPKAEPIFITGHVQSPGQYPGRRALTVQQALSMAGGLTDRGSSRGIRIQRIVDGKKEEIPVKDMSVDLVKPGDTINVPARIF
jgi:polysaccharide export outer membrane protein